jgi:hypothetical protein
LEESWQCRYDREERHFGGWQNKDTHTTGKHPQGRAVNNVVVFDKQ